MKIDINVNWHDLFILIGVPAKEIPNFLSRNGGPSAKTISRALKGNKINHASEEAILNSIELGMQYFSKIVSPRVTSNEIRIALKEYSDPIEKIRCALDEFIESKFSSIMIEHSNIDEDQRKSIAIYRMTIIIGFMASIEMLPNFGAESWTSYWCDYFPQRDPNGASNTRMPLWWWAYQLREKTRIDKELPGLPSIGEVISLFDLKRTFERISPERLRNINKARAEENIFSVSKEPFSVSELAEELDVGKKQLHDWLSAKTSGSLPSERSLSMIIHCIQRKTKIEIKDEQGKKTIYSEGATILSVNLLAARIMHAIAIETIKAGAIPTEFKEIQSVYTDACMAWWKYVEGGSLNNPLIEIGKEHHPLLGHKHLKDGKGLI